MIGVFRTDSVPPVGATIPVAPYGLKTLPLAALNVTVPVLLPVKAIEVGPNDSEAVYSNDKWLPAPTPYEPLAVVVTAPNEVD